MTNPGEKATTLILIRTKVFLPYTNDCCNALHMQKTPSTRRALLKEFCL